MTGPAGFARALNAGPAARTARTTDHKPRMRGEVSSSSHAQILSVANGKE